MYKIKSHSFVQDKTSIISPLVKIYRNNKENVEKQEMKKNSWGMNKFKINLNEVLPVKININRMKSKSTMTGSNRKDIERTPLKSREMNTILNRNYDKKIINSSNSFRKSVELNQKNISCRAIQKFNPVLASPNLNDKSNLHLPPITSIEKKSLICERNYSSTNRK